jgi:hypothetical protein
MPERHEFPRLPVPLVSERNGDQLHVRLPEGEAATFRTLMVPSLTRRVAEQVVDDAGRGSDARIFVSYGNASAEARNALRAAGISFAGQDGRVFVRAPGILVDRDVPAKRGGPAPRWAVDVDVDGSLRNPFAKRSSRVPRWLLLHHEESFALSELARAVDLNHAAVSRIVRTLEDAALVRDLSPAAGGRRRNVRLQRPRDLLDTWLPHWQRRRVRHRHWDVGARDVEEAVTLVNENVGEQVRWALGGLAGAALVRQAVEPADALVWIGANDVSPMANLLQPEPARGGRGLLRVAVAPDEWTLGLANRASGVPIADAAQLWLDCASEGERALEAADALAEVSGWT